MRPSEQSRLQLGGPVTLLNSRALPAGERGAAIASVNMQIQPGFQLIRVVLEEGPRYLDSEMLAASESQAVARQAAAAAAELPGFPQSPH